MLYRITFLRVSGGQVRDFGPTENIYRMKIERGGTPLQVSGWHPYEDAPNSYVRKLAKAVGPWHDEGEGDWASARLVHLNNVGPGDWEWKTSEPWDD